MLRWFFSFFLNMNLICSLPKKYIYIYIYICKCKRKNQAFEIIEVLVYLIKVYLHYFNSVMISSIDDIIWSYYSSFFCVSKTLHTRSVIEVQIRMLENFGQKKNEEKKNQILSDRNRAKIWIAHSKSNSYTI